MSIIPEHFAKPRVAGRHAWTSLLLAGIPGFGQFYHRLWLKGVIFLVPLARFIGGFAAFLRVGPWGLV